MILIRLAAGMSEISSLESRDVDSLSKSLPRSAETPERPTTDALRQTGMPASVSPICPRPLSTNSALSRIYATARSSESCPVGYRSIEVFPASPRKIPHSCPGIQRPQIFIVSDAGVLVIVLPQLRDIFWSDIEKPWRSRSQKRSMSRRVDSRTMLPHKRSRRRSSASLMQVDGRNRMRLH